MKTASSMYIQILFIHLRRLGVTKEKFLKKYDLSDVGSIEEFVLLSDVFKYWALAESELNNPAIGFDVGRHLQHADVNLFTYAAMNCKTIAEAFSLALQFQPLLCSSFNTELINVDKHTVQTVLRYENVSAEEGRHLVELDFSQSLSLIRILLSESSGKDASFSKVYFRHSEKYPVSYYERFFGCRVKFNMPDNCVFIKNELLERKITGHNSAVKDVIVKQMNHYAEKGNKTRARPLSLQVSQYIKNNLGQDMPGMFDASEHFAMSVSTFRRRLALEKTSYQCLRNEIRCSLAEHLLVNSDYSIERISDDLSFSSSSTFIRAFKRWKAGVTPMDYRMSRLEISENG